MRLTSEIWVSALLRRAAAAGAQALVRRHGDDTAGAVFVLVDRLDGTADLHAPRVQSAFDEADDGDRRLETTARAVPLAEIEARLASEARFDSDLWIVVVEDRAGRSFVEAPPFDPEAPAPVRPVWPPKLD